MAGGGLGGCQASLLVVVSAPLLPATFCPSSTMHDLAGVVHQLWEADANRLVPGADYALNLQNAKVGWVQRE
jgi:hypothetical protein